MDQLYLGMFGDITEESPSTSSPLLYEDDPAVRNRNRMRSIINSILRKAPKGPGVAPNLPPCPLCNIHQKLSFLDANIKYEDVSKRYDVILEQPTGLLFGYSKDHPKMTLEERSRWKSTQMFGPLGLPLVRMKRRMRGVARIVVRIWNKDKKKK